MHRVLLLGAGKIGRMIARFLMDSGDYDVLVGDVSEMRLATDCETHRGRRLAGLMPQTRPIWLGGKEGVAIPFFRRSVFITTQPWHGRRSIAG